LTKTQGFCSKQQTNPNCIVYSGVSAAGEISRRGTAYRRVLQPRKQPTAT